MEAFVVSVSPCRFIGSRTSMVTPRRQRYVWTMSTKRSVVWIRRGDCRTIDHSGLAAASNSDAVAAYAVVQPNSDPAIFMALASALKKRGVPLSLVAAEDEARAVAKFATKFNATSVHVRLDETEDARGVIGSLARTLPSDIAVNTWQDEYRSWNVDRLGDIPEEYPAFKRWRARQQVEFKPSDMNNELYFPTSNFPLSVPSSTDVQSLSIGKNESSLYEAVEKRYADDSALANTITVDRGELDVDEYGELIVRRYLEAAEFYGEPDLARTLAPVLREGLVSPRRMREIVVAYERENGRLWQPIYRAGAKLLLEYLDAREFAQLFARRDLETLATVDGEHRARFWRWKGFLVRYVAEGDNMKAPPLVLVHGFGASSQHFARSIKLLKRKYRVYALDLVGYGRSEKPPTAYTADLWEMVLFDFVREVVDEPVYVAGNSIGGYFSASFGSDAYPDWCAGICLLNSAGKLEPPPGTPPPPQPRRGPLSTVFGLGKQILEQLRPARMLVANILLNNLRRRAGKTLKAVYPTHPECADEELACEIYRNSLDFGADFVLASGLVLPPPRSLSALLRKYDGPLLVYQGMLDPLNSSSDRAEKIRQEYPTATIVQRKLGHCPHDEDAEDFAQSISAWMDANNGNVDIHADEGSAVAVHA